MNKLITPNRILWIIMLFFSVTFIIIEYGRYGDFGIYFEASTDLFKGENIYYKLYSHGAEKLFRYPGSPLLAILLYPLTLFSLNTAALIFKFISVLMLFRIWKLIEKYFDLTILTIDQRKWWITLVFISSIFPIYSNFHSIQFTFLLLYCILEGIHRIKDKNHIFFGGFLIAVGIFSKISPIVVIPYLLYRGHFKAVIYIGCSLVLLFLIPAFFLGWNDNALLWSSWIDLISNDDVGVFDTGNRTNAGISALISSLLIPGIKNSYVTLSVRRHVYDLNPDIVVYIIQIARFLFISFMLYFLRTLPFRSEKNKLHEIWEISYLLMAIPIIFPQQRPYNFIYLMPAFSYCIYAFFTSKKSGLSYRKIFFILAIVIINLELLLGSFRAYYWYYRTITYGTLILLVVLSLFNPFKFDKN